MGNKQWVQHKSGQGEKWEVQNFEHHYPHLWRATDHQDRGNDADSCVWLPKTEYILCDPPEEWEVVAVTVECEWTDSNLGEFYIKMSGGARMECKEDLHQRGNYRVRKVDGLHHGPAFIVERKKL